MNTITQQNLKLAETFKSLSLEPSHKTAPTKVRAGRLSAISSLLLVLVITSISVTIFWPDIRPWLQEVNLFVQEYTSSSEPVQAEAPTDANLSSALPVPTYPAPAREITGSGYVIAPDMVRVFSKYEGQTASVAVSIGDRVEAGQVLVKINNIGARFALEQANAASAMSKLVHDERLLELDQANNTLQRAKALSAKKVVSVKTVDESQTTKDIAQNAVDQARQSYSGAQLGVKIAQEKIDALIVRAPIAGTVTRLNAHIGGRVLARLNSIKENESLLTITDTMNLVIDADVAETNIGKLRPGLRGEAVLDGIPDKPFAIEIAQLWPIASVAKGTITLRLKLLDPPSGILPNMAARIRLSLDPAKQQGDTP